MAEDGRRKATARGRGNDPDRTRTDILDVATAHFSRQGLSGSRVDEIAAETHTSKRMLYYYFGSKEGLYRAVLSRCYAGIRANENAVDVAALDPREALIRIVEATFDHHAQSPDFVRIVMVENIHRGEHIAAVPGIEERGPGVLALLRDVLARGEATGAFRAGIDPLDLHLTMTALAFYNVSNRHTVGAIFGRDPRAPDEHARRRGVVVDTVLRWVASPCR